jgi:hypothetical protein
MLRPRLASRYGLDSTYAPKYSLTNAFKARFEAVKAKYWLTPFKSVPPNALCGDCQTSWDSISRVVGAAVSNPLVIDFAFWTSVRLAELEMGK